MLHQRSRIQQNPIHPRLSIVPKIWENNRTESTFQLSGQKLVKAGIDH